MMSWDVLVWSAFLPVMFKVSIYTPIPVVLINVTRLLGQFWQTASDFCTLEQPRVLKHRVIRYEFGHRESFWRVIRRVCTEERS